MNGKRVSFGKPSMYSLEFSFLMESLSLHSILDWKRIMTVWPDNELAVGVM